MYLLFLVLLGVLPPLSVTLPKAQSVVSVKETVSGKFSVGWPVIVVRTPTGEVYAQPPAVCKAQEFTGEAFFGDKDNTGRGTRYELLVLIASNQEAANAIKPGLLKELPKFPVAVKQFVYRDERIEFGGQTWAVKKASRMDPGPNRWTNDTSAVFLDDKKHLYLGIVPADKGWACTEVVCNDALGFGTYTWTFRTDLSKFDPQAVFGLFTYQNSANKQGIPDKEIDFELSRWGDPNNELGQFVVQPYIGQGKKNIERFPVLTNAKQPLTAKYVWSQGKVEAICTDASGRELRKWTYKTGDEPSATVPPAEGKERAIANLWLHEGKSPQLGKPVSVVIESFRFEKQP